MELTERKRDPERTKAAILAAALESFTEKGFAGASLRDIAAKAGVSHGLLRRHFGSKEDLFLKAIPGTREWIATVKEAGAEQMPAAAARMFCERIEAGSSLDFLMILIRSASEKQDANTMRLFEEVRKDSIELYGPIMEGEGKIGRAEALLAIMIGMTFMRHIMGTGEIASLGKDEFSSLVEKTFLRMVRATDASWPCG